jgi:hypothetical protein
MFQVECLFLDGVEWNEEEVKVSPICGININCLADRLLSVTEAWKKKVCRPTIFCCECIAINNSTLRLIS